MIAAFAQRLILAGVVLGAAGSFCEAATEPGFGKDVEQIDPAPPPCDRYHANEWDISLWGALSSAGDTGNNRVAHVERGPENGSLNDIGHISHNRLFGGADVVGGGGLDLKYFFTEHCGLGLEGFLLDASHVPVGAELATVTFRYPIGCSRFSPYVWAGIGALEGGFHTILVFTEKNEVERNEFRSRSVTSLGARALGQVGGGVEMRLIRSSSARELAIGLIADFAWNVADGPNNNFGLARFGLNFAY